MLDREEIEGLQLLLAAGADPNETNERGETALHWAVWRGRSPKTIAILLDHGANIDMPRQDLRTAYALSVLSGQGETSELLKARGASTDLSPFDQYVATRLNAVVEGPVLSRVKTIDLDPSPGNERLLPDLAAAHRTSAVRALLEAGVPVNARGEAGGTALHWACWNGYADIAELLIAHSASLAAEDSEFHATPSGWLHHGTTNSPERDGDRAGIARLLIAAGAPMEGCNTHTGNADVDAVLREHKLIE